MGLSPVTHASSQSHGSKVSIVDLLGDEVHVAGRPLHVFNAIAPEPYRRRHFRKRRCPKHKEHDTRNPFASGPISPPHPLASPFPPA